MACNTLVDACKGCPSLSLKETTMNHRLSDLLLKSVELQAHPIWMIDHEIKSQIARSVVSEKQNDRCKCPAACLPVGAVLMLFLAFLKYAMHETSYVHRRVKFN